VRRPARHSLPRLAKPAIGVVLLELKREQIQREGIEIRSCWREVRAFFFPARAPASGFACTGSNKPAQTRGKARHRAGGTHAVFV
ncbi:MAG: hypothetical protein WCL11_15675, partial [Verrucomicrobiota bacterium]